NGNNDISYTFHYKNKMTFFESHLSCQGKKYYTFLNTRGLEFKNIRFLIN
ncbi:MAG: hypothetical protein HZB65_00870, partial [Candidatus Aenigmarchaeota archaeon]|nr:hypothetical protein [Candidatus Aenigmarchaeota archaeon]